MTVYVVNKNQQPCLATLSEAEACDVFEKLVRSGSFRQAAVHIVSIANSLKRFCWRRTKLTNPRRLSRRSAPKAWQTAKIPLQLIGTSGRSAVLSLNEVRH